MDLTKRTFLVIDAGGTFLKSALLNADAEILKGSSFKTRSFSEGPREQIIKAYGKTVSEALAYISRNHLKICGIGITTPGPFDYEKGIPLMKHKFSSIYGFNLRKLIVERSNLSGEVPVHFMHDANAALTGEIWKGNAKGYNNAALVTLGTGLGFSFSQKGKVQTGSQGGPAVSVYSMPCREGILEDYVSARGILKMYREITGTTDIKETEVSDIGMLADRGDRAGRESFREAGYILAGSIRDILHERNIQCLLFGGQISRSFHHMEEGFRAGLQGMKALNKISTVKDMDNAAFLGVLREIMND
jgi:glucokinase